MNTAIQDIKAQIDQAVRILLVGHVDPDGDAIGSLLGLGHALNRLGKTVTLACPSDVPAKYEFLPGSQLITTTPRGDFDLAISLDNSDRQRMGAIYSNSIQDAGKPLINVDHHVTNVQFGLINWVDTEAVATAEMIVTLVDSLGVEIDREMALPLLTGIVTDTRGFRTPNMTSRVLRVASRLLDTGVTLAEILERTVNVRPYSMICLWGKMLQTSHLADGIAWTALTPQMKADCGAQDDGDGGFVSFLASAREAAVGVVFHDRGNGGVEVGLRSKPGVSVAEVALSLGGGGHPQAAGCTVHGSLADVQDQVLRAVRKAIAGQQTVYS